jgi:hypothetical protein
MSDLPSVNLSTRLTDGLIILGDLIIPEALLLKSSVCALGKISVEVFYNQSDKQ